MAVAKGFQGGRPRILPRLVLLAVAAVMCLVSVEVFRIIAPFQPQNPFWQEATIGEPVIDGWMYGGKDQHGNLKFFNQLQYVEVPANEKVFDADGKFVVIEHSTPSSLTFAEPAEAVPIGWWLALLAAITGAVMWLLQRRPGQRRRLFPRRF